MNKKDIATIRKQFKLDNELLNIETIFNVYVQKETGDVYHHISQPFGMLDKESQELFLVNFKKVLTGQVDTKLFELRFAEGVEESTQTILFEGLRAEETTDWEDYMLDIVDKMFEQKKYDFDTVVTFIIGKYLEQDKNKGFDPDEGITDNQYVNKFILCSLNKTSQPEKSLVFDYIEKSFKANSNIDPIINLTAPLTGFLFPTITSNATDVNHILYNSGKANQPSALFIEDVLNCEPITTAAEDKDCFGLIVNNLAGEKVNSDLVSNIYEEIDRRVQDSIDDDEDEDPIINYRDVEQILTTNGIEDVDTEKVKEAFKTVIDNEQHSFKATNLMPKALKINTEIAKISINRKDLKNIKYITYKGKRCLLIEVDEDVEIEGFQLESLAFE